MPTQPIRYHYRIRRSKGNRKSWTLVRLLSDGSESDLLTRTALSLDVLIREVPAGHAVEVIG